MPFDPFGSSDLPRPYSTAQGPDTCSGEEPDRPWYDLGGHWNDMMGALRGMIGLENDTVDASDAYAANNDYRIYFQHIATGTTSIFKAFLTDFDDQYSSEWNDVDVYGRMDPITTFQGTRRQINFSFDVVAASAAQAQKNYEESYKLIKSLYPVYGARGQEDGGYSATSLKAPPLLRIRFKNLIRAGHWQDHGGPQACANIPLVGKLSGLSYRPNMDVGFFETKDAIYPKVNSFSCNFTVLHTGPVGWYVGEVSADSGGDATEGEGGEETAQDADGSGEETPAASSGAEDQVDGDIAEDEEDTVLV